VGGDGQNAGGAEGTLKIAVEPGALYYMATSVEPRVTPVGRPLILSRMPEEWFNPDE
jgi:hypothetical protein